MLTSVAEFINKSGLFAYQHLNVFHGKDKVMSPYFLVTL